MTNSKRGSGDKFDAQMDESLYLAFKAYAQAVDAARALSDRLLTEGRAEDANAVIECNHDHALARQRSTFKLPAGC